jgi:hypothetical protein
MQLVLSAFISRPTSPLLHTGTTNSFRIWKLTFEIRLIRSSHFQCRIRRILTGDSYLHMPTWSTITCRQIQRLVLHAPPANKFLLFVCVCV